MSFNLFIDDIRDPHYRECLQSGVDPNLDWVIARTSEEAKAAVLEYGMMPDRLALDHDLGYVEGIGIDEVPKFLHWLANEFWDGQAKIPTYTIHSANSTGRLNMYSFMESWKKSVDLSLKE